MPPDPCRPPPGTEPGSVHLLRHSGGEIERQGRLLADGNWLIDDAVIVSPEFLVDNGWRYVGPAGGRP